MKVTVTKDAPIVTISVNRAEVRNAIDRETAELLAQAFRDFEEDDDLKVAVLAGQGGQFGAGADLKSIARGERLRFEETGDSPLGPIRMRLSKPVIAAVQGYAVAGGMALALWCDMRVMEKTATFGMFDRRYGVPMLGAVTVNLPRLIGLSRAMDLILTGRAVDAEEAFHIGLANRLTEAGEGLVAAQDLAREIASFPWECVVNDRKALLDAMDMTSELGQRNEFRLGMEVFDGGIAKEGAGQFAAGQGRHGKFE